MKPIRPLLSFVTLALGVAALACVMVPRVLNDARASSSAAEGATAKQADLHLQPGARVFEYKGVRIAYNASVRPQASQADPAAVAKPKRTNWFPLAALLLALTGTLLGFVACWREQSNVLVVPGISFCMFVLFWPYLSPVLGVALGVVLLLFLLGSFTPLFSF